MLSKIIKPGDKLELQKVERVQENGDIAVYKKVYHSKVCEILSEDRMEITMPIEKGKLVLLQVDNEYDLYIVNYSSGISIRTSNDNIDVGTLVSKFGGGGHPGAGGIRIDKELQVSQIERNLPHTKFYREWNRKIEKETTRCS